MKKKNKKLKLLVRVLLVTIGVSFAFFISRVLLDGTGGSSKGTTAIIDGAKLTLEGNLEFTDLNILPGHKNVSSLKITATGENEFVPYKVIWEGTNTLNTPLNFTVYKTTENLSVSATCEKKTKVQDGAQILNEECTISNIESLGEVLSSGTINTSTSLSKVILIDKEAITATNSGEVVYYYVVLEYPNLQEAQNSDIGGTFTGKVRVESTETLADITIAKVYLENEDTGEYEEVSDLPQKDDGYVFNNEESTCTNSAIPSWIDDTWTLMTSNFTSIGTECNLYFDESNPYAARESILANITTITTRTDFDNVYTSSTTGTIFTAEDNDGTSYYFAGAPTDNWVKFGGFYWRIIRINGDGTIRLIYNGTSTTTTGTGTQITTCSFNSNASNNMYAGYMYTSGSVHGDGTSSTIKDVLDSWYDSNLASYASNIDKNAGFCNDRVPSTNKSSSNGSGGTGTTSTYYAAYIRLVTNKTPTLKCSNSNDLFTQNDSSKGNKKLSKPIGLLTADEVAYAGGVVGTNNTSYYLYNNSYYWTISPYYFYIDFVGVFYVYSNGRISNLTDGDYVVSARGVRPVINLRADLELKGNGTTTSPYEIVSD